MKRRSIFISALALSLLLMGGCGKASEQTEHIGTEQAKTLALKAAGLSSGQASFSGADVSSRDGIDYYQVTFAAQGREYRYDIHAVTGVVMEERAVEIAPQSAPASSEKKLLTEEQAKSKALAHAGVKAADATFVECKLDRDDGRAVYDIEFYSGAKEYDYEVDAYTGAILAFDYDAEQYAPPAPSSEKKLLTEEQAKSKALAHAGVKAADVTFVECNLDRDDGRTVYEIEFYSGNKEYDYEVDGYTGKILSFDYDAEKYAPSQSSSSSISADEAKKLALAKVPGAQLKDIREFETDRDDGRLEYEGTIIYQEKEYEFEIDGSNGAIRSWDVESIYD